MANMTEVDEAELVALRRNSTLLDRAMNSKAREQLLRALKVGTPDLPVPEIDAKEPVMEAIGQVNTSIAEMRKLIDDDKAAREDEKRMAKLNAQWSAGRVKAAKEGYDGDALKALEDFMQEKGIAEHEIAIPAFERMHPPSAPIISSSNKFDFFNKPNADSSDQLMKKLWSGDSDGFLNDSINQTLKEMRGAA